MEWFDPEEIKHPDHFAASFITTGKQARTEMINALIRSTNRILLITKTKQISNQLIKKGATFSILRDYEYTLAELLRPKKKHFRARFLVTKYYDEKAAPYLAEIKKLKKTNRLGSRTLMPIVARMANEEGRALVQEYFNRTLHSIGSDKKDKEIYETLKSIEDSIFNVQKKLTPDLKKNWPLVANEFVKFNKINKGLLFIDRTKLDKKLKAYSKVLFDYLNHLESNKERPHTSKPGPANIVGQSEYKDFPKEAIPEAPPAVETGSKKEKDLLVMKITDVYRAVSNSEGKETWLNLIQGERVISDEERERIDFIIEDIKDLAELTAAPSKQTDVESAKQKYIKTLIYNLNRKEHITDKKEIINIFKKSGSNSLINDVETIYNILLKREGKKRPAGKDKKITAAATQVAVQGLEEPSDEAEKLTEQKKEAVREIVGNVAANLDDVLAGGQTDRISSLKAPETESQEQESEDYNLDVLFKGEESKDDFPNKRTQYEQKVDEEEIVASILSYSGDIPAESIEAIEESLVDIHPAAGIEDETAQVEIDLTSAGSAGGEGEKSNLELNAIYEITSNIIADDENIENFCNLGSACGSSLYLSSSRLADEISRIIESIEDKKTENKFKDILQVSRRMIKEVDTLPSLNKKIITLRYWIDIDYTDQSHIREFLKGQIVELKKFKASGENLLGRLFTELKEIDHAEAKIEYLKEKHEEPEYKHLKLTIVNIIEDIRSGTNLEAENISTRWIEDELNRIEDMDARHNWLKRRRFLSAFRDFTDYMDLKITQIEEHFEEEVLIEGVKAGIEKRKQDGEKPYIHSNIITLTRAELNIEGVGKRQSYIKEQEILYPQPERDEEKRYYNYFQKQKKLLFYLMNTDSDEPYLRVKVLADRVSLTFKEKQEYFKILKSSKLKDKAGNTVSLQDELGITDFHIAYFAVYILAFERPLEERIRFIDKFRKDDSTEAYVKYKEDFGITSVHIDKVMEELRKKLV